MCAFEPNTSALTPSARGSREPEPSEVSKRRVNTTLERRDVRFSPDNVRFTPDSGHS